MFDNLMSIDSGTAITIHVNVFVLSNNAFESIVYKEQTTFLAEIWSSGILRKVTYPED